MQKMSVLDRILLLLTALLAAYQVSRGVEGLYVLSLVSETIAFGVLLVAGLLLIIFDFEVLDSPIVVIVSTIIPLSLSLGLVTEYLPRLRIPYLIFAVLGFLLVAVTRLAVPKIAAVMILAIVHGVAGIVIFLLPIILSVRGDAPLRFALVGVGGALIGLGGLLLSFLKAGKPIVPRKTILRVLPGLLLLMTAAFVFGLR
jgi:hypothetical protein